MKEFLTLQISGTKRMVAGEPLLHPEQGPKCANYLLKDGLRKIATFAAIIAIDRKKVDLSFRPPEGTSGWINQRRTASCYDHYRSSRCSFLMTHMH